METIKAKDIKLFNGIATKRYEGRTVMSVTGLSPDAELEFYKRVSRWTGTGYKDNIYRIVGTEDALIIKHNDGALDNIGFQTVSIYSGYFAKKQEFAKIVGQYSRKYSVPFEVALAIGDNEDAYVLFKATMQNSITKDTYNDLCAGIGRRKRGIKEVLGEPLYNLIGVERMGQEHSSRIANYILDCQPNNN